MDERVSVQADLLGIDPVLQWLPDEILFGLAFRYHFLSGHALASSTCQQLYGHPLPGSRQDFPCRLDDFIKRTRGLLGTAESIVCDHTILPFYLPFCTPSASEDAIGVARGPTIGSFKYRLGILTSRFRANHPLKACSSCSVVSRHVDWIKFFHRADDGCAAPPFEESTHA